MRYYLVDATIKAPSAAAWRDFQRLLLAVFLLDLL
jgi:hypothetical protein